MASQMNDFLKKKWRQAFQFLDVDQDGFLTAEDSALMAENLSRVTNANKEQADILMKDWMKWHEHLNFDKKIKVDEERFVTAHAELYEDVTKFKRLERDTASAIFDRIDMNGDGIISLQEFKLFYNAVGIYDEPFILETFKNIDADGDGTIKREEFINDEVRFFTDPDPVSGKAYLFIRPERK